jgi:hypothetical protein
MIPNLWVDHNRREPVGPAMATRAERRRRELAAQGWQPLAKAVQYPPTAERIAAIRLEAERRGGDPDVAEQMVREVREVWQNGLYTVIVTRHATEGWVDCLSIRRNDREADPFPWRHLQRIKSQLAGEGAEAMELFPAESRLMDTANQRWLWCFPPGYTIPAGFNRPRTVATPEEAERVGAKQAPEQP